MTDIDWSGCPIVQRNPKKMGGVPTVRAWRMPADSVVENHDYGATDQEIAEWYELPLEDVHHPRLRRPVPAQCRTHGYVGDVAREAAVRASDYR